MLRIRFVQLTSKIVTPAFRKRFGFDRSLQHCGIRPGGVKTNDVIYTDTGFISRQTLDPVSGPNLSFARNCEIESGASRDQQSLQDVGPAKLDAELVTRQARRRRHHLRSADAKPVADVDVSFQQALDRKVFAEHSEWQVHTREFTWPMVIMVACIGVDG